MIDMHPEVRLVRVLPGDETGLECLIQLLTMLHAETPHAPLSLPKLRRHVEGVLAQGFVLVSVTPEGRMAGSLGLSLDAPFFSEQEWLRDEWLFVHPECRRTPHARMLVRAAKLLARDMKKPLRMEVSGFGARIAGKVRLFERELGPPNGASWIIPVTEAA